MRAIRPGAMAGRSIVYLLLAAFGIIMVMPFYWMIVSSLHTPQNLVAYPPQWWPRPAVLTHYQNALAKAPFLLYYRNSLIVAIISVGLSLLLGLFAGYAFAIYSFPLKGFFFFLILATLMVPIQVTSVSLYILMAQDELDRHLSRHPRPGPCQRVRNVPDHPGHQGNADGPHPRRPH